MTTVVAALIERDGHILICRRRGDQDHAGKWEFPGGKVEPGEEPKEALARELREELAIEAAIGGEVTRYEFAYPGRKPIRLLFYRVREFNGEPDYEHFAETAWASPAALPEYDFLEGDVEFVRKLARGELA
ncbi:MAG: (deoxy)nucleoside triphosphate pyrophosphohydrolase [Verrucomicrobiales bacterium]|nr:(deoxy)nucleoside triphosphate pyrophosphohydrolase [Verrucomicrobiales bacterium]